MAKKIKNPEIIFDFDNEEDLDICGFSDEPIKGTCIATFSCSNNNSNSEIREAAADQLNADDNNSAAKSLSVNQNDSTSNDQITNTNEITKIITTATGEPASKNKLINPVTTHNSNDNDILFDNRNLPIVNGCAPPIYGEYLDTKRTYMLRKSTVRKINQLKSMNPDLNTYVSTIVDLAIAHYYDHIIHDANSK